MKMSRRTSPAKPGGAAECRVADALADQRHALEDDDDAENAAGQGDAQPGGESGMIKFEFDKIMPDGHVRQ